MYAKSERKKKKKQKKEDTALKKSFNLQQLCSEGDL